MDKLLKRLHQTYFSQNDACGRAEEAVRYYTEVFRNSEVGMISRYGNEEAESSRAKVNYAAFSLAVTVMIKAR